MALREVDAFGSLVRGYRRSLGLTQEELAERAGLSERAVRAIERGGEHAPRKDTVQLLADALELGRAEREAFQLAARRKHVPSHHVPPHPVDRDLVTAPTNLPHDPTPFIGREAEVAQLVALLQRPAVRLATLTGPGGIGKTRLALQASLQLHTVFKDGVFVVSLASLHDPDLVPSAIARTFRIEERAGQPLLDSVIGFLQTKRMLLVLDNYEHLLPAAEVVSSLLAACPHLQILVTSRAVLRLAAEHEYPVPPLAVPDLAHLPDIDTLAQYDAVALFLERAERVKPTFALTPKNAGEVAEICVRLDGLPLAIELAATRLRMFAPQGLLERLSRRLDLLTGGARDRPERHQTLRGAIDWSYSLLTPAEQTLFARLSVFAGGCTLEAAERVCNPDGELGIDILTGMTSLVEQSLVRREREDEPRCVMLETIRQYAAERLEGAGDAEIRKQHAAYFLSVAEKASEELFGPVRVESLERLEGEHDNLRKALRWAQETREAEPGLRLAIALGPFWEARGYVREGRRWLTELLACDGGTAPDLRARALKAAASLALVHRDLRSVHELLEGSLDLFREVGDERAMAGVLARMGGAASMAHNPGPATQALEQGITLARSLGDQAMISSFLDLLASVKLSQSDVAGALPLAEESLVLARELGKPSLVADALNMMLWAVGRTHDVRRARALLEEGLALLHSPDFYLDAHVVGRIQGLSGAARLQGEYEVARTLCEHALALSVDAGDAASAGQIRVTLALLDREQGRFERARMMLEESLSVFQDLGDPGGTALALVGLSDVARDQGDAEQIIDFAQRSLALFRELDWSFAGYALHNLAMAAWLQGEHDRARSLLAEALALQSLDEDRAEMLLSTGLVELEAGEHRRAEHTLAQVLRLGLGRHVVWLASPTLEGLAGVAVRDGRMEQAVRLFGAADALRRRIGTPLTPLHRPLYERHVAAAGTVLGQEQLDKLWEEGRAMALEQAMSHALGDDTGPEGTRGVETASGIAVLPPGRSHE